MQIKNDFFSSLNGVTSRDEINRLWSEIESAYSSKYRHYHTLIHLKSLIEILTPFKSEFKRWDVIVLAIAYHDFIYDVLKSDNEERSAQLAEERLKKIGVDEDGITLCVELILATKKHQPVNRVIDLFTDADLSILGSDQNIYKNYAECIRKEYSIFPSLVYNPGRKKVIRHFIEMKRIFKTDEFFGKYESQARQNLEAELTALK